MTWLAGEPTSRPGSNSDAWWNLSGQRRMTVELAYLIWEAPLDLSSDERRFLWMLWRHDRRQDWPPDQHWALLFDVHERTIRRWRQRLVEAGTLQFYRPHNSPGNPEWRYQPSGVYDLKPPSQWRYLNGWRYGGADVGWIDATGARVASAQQPHELPFLSDGQSRRASWGGFGVQPPGPLPLERLPPAKHGTYGRPDMPGDG